MITALGRLVSAADYPMAFGSLTVHRIDVGSNAFLVENDSGMILIDAGYPGNQEKILKAMNVIAPEKSLLLIFITHGHFDHYGSAAAVREATGAPIAIHRLDSEAMENGETPLPHTRNGGFFGKLVLPLAEKVWRTVPTRGDRLLESENRLENLGCNARVVHIPGHTAGSSGLLLQDSLFFAGDLISTKFGVMKQKWYAANWEEIDSSITKVNLLTPAVVFPGHGRKIVRPGDLRKLVAKE